MAMIRIVESDSPDAGLSGVAARPVANGERFHSEAPLLCAITSDEGSARSCDGCLRPLAPLRDHLEAATPMLLASLPADITAQVCSGHTAAALSASTFNCDQCGLRVCNACAGTLLARHTPRACAARSNVRVEFPQMWANARFRLFIQLLEMESVAGRGDTASAAAITALDRLCAGTEAPSVAVAAAFEDAMRPALALLRMAWLDDDVPDDSHAAIVGSAAAERLRARLTPAAYRVFHQRVAANTHGVRIAASPAVGALAELLGLASTLETDHQGYGDRSHAIIGAVRDVLRSDQSVVAPIVGSALFEVGARLNHSCVPNVEVVGDDEVNGAGRLALRSTRAIAEGEELTISYLSPAELDESAIERRSQLRERYGFACVCPLCVSEDVDARYELAVARLRRDEPYHANPPPPPSDPGPKHANVARADMGARVRASSNLRGADAAARRRLDNLILPGVEHGSPRHLLDSDPR